jgi:hypothetical protein
MSWVTGSVNGPARGAAARAGLFGRNRADAFWPARIWS